MRARVRRDQVRAGQLAVAAVGRVFANSGGGVLHLTNPIQRAWRDVNAGALHNSNVPEPLLIAYGAIQLGHPASEFGI